MLQYVCRGENKALDKEEMMKTMPLFTFVVRKGFADFKEKQLFEATVVTYVVDGIEMQDFRLPDGRELKGVPCENTKFHN